jgi:hypothetical protein
MKRVQHNEIKQYMTIKLPTLGPSGRWVTIHRVIEVRPATTKQAACALVLASYLNGRIAGKPFQVFLYERTDGYEVHANNAMIAAKAQQRVGRADVKNIVLRDYLIKFSAVDRVDNQGETCGYCHEGDISCNVYAMVTADSGRIEESTWPTCDPCALYSIDQVEDVDPSYAITIERTGP